jgi:chemotaxis protein methyltransferase CheR
MGTNDPTQQFKPKSNTFSPVVEPVDSPRILSDAEYKAFAQFYFAEIGINLPIEKKTLIVGRLSRRLDALNLSSFRQYYELIQRPDQAAERQTAIDLITTNETFFFREPAQLKLLRDRILPKHGNGLFRLWCAASSTGEEPYSLAMLLDHQRGNLPWQLIASDISSRALATARTGLYQMQRTDQIPIEYLKRYCRKGQGQYENHLLVDRSLRQRVDFRMINLMQVPSDLGLFDAIFIRNVIIYFDAPTKRTVLDNVLRRLKPGGLLCLGHSESVHGTGLPLTQIAPATYLRAT